LSTGGGSSGMGLTLDVGNFCCQEYLMTMVQRIRENWDPHADNPAETGVKFTVQRDGRLIDVQVEKSSGFTLLDLSAQRALVSTRQLPPLPAAYPNPTLTVHVTFQYTR